ncbi:MAG: M28 family metallopeptidase [Caldilineaceae bacterium]|nr:M28 family metallopeptidase [Caldilineaceae bacterium]
MAGWKFKRFSRAGLFLLAAILLVACRPIDDQIAHYLAHGPTSTRPYVATGPSCTELEETAQETLADVGSPPATARFSVADRKALAIAAFSHLCELTREVGWRQSATAEESKAAELLMDRFTEFGYSPEMQDFQVRIGSLRRGSRNIILELPGQGEGVVILGAHYDTVRNSVGANDNASGVGVLLAVAERLAQPPWSSQMVSVFPFTLRIIAFGSEETGMSGSWHYVDQLTEEESDDIKIMINLDSVGSGTFLRGPGDRWLTSHVSVVASREGVSYTSITEGYSGSDHVPFRYSAEIPVISFSGNDMSRINTRDDTIEFINPVLLGDTAVLVLVLLASLEDL